MDTTKKYIEMCEKAEEVQVLRPQLKSEIMEKSYYAKKFVWLPRQDQLQEMVFGDRNYFKLNNDFNEFVQSQRPRVGGDITVLKANFGSMEQLWLAFVMAQKFNKVWNGKEWLIDQRS